MAKGRKAKVKEDNKEKRFSCEKCPYKTNDSSNFYKHQRAIHEKSSIFECKQCSYTSRDRSNLAKHVEVQHQKLKKYNCNKCDMSYAFKHDLNLHIKVKHEQIKDLKCDICDFKTVYIGSLQAHTRLVHGDESKNMPCIVNGCPKMFKSRQGVSHHLKRVHQRIKNHECSKCEKKFATPSELKVHIKMAHEWKEEDGLNCDICNKVLKNKASLLAHVNHMHVIREKCVQCKNCKKKFYTNNEMERHFMGVHEKKYRNEKFFKIPSICDICDKIFNSTKAMKYHKVEMHSEVTRHKCEVCIKYFAVESRLKIHFQNHHKDLDYEVDNKNDKAIFHCVPDKEETVTINFESENLDIVPKVEEEDEAH